MNLTLRWILLIFTLLLGYSYTVKATPCFESKHQMSSTFLKIIPTNPSYIPDKIKQDNAIRFLSKLYKNERLTLFSTDTIEFVDQGENFDSVTCNLCNKTINIEYWQDEMDEAYKSHFKNLVFQTPCCKKKTSLNDLHYHSPAGFAKFVISIEDAENDLSEKDLKALQAILGIPLKIIWAHY